MNIISDEQRQQKAKSLPIAFDHMYSSPESGFAISRVYKKYHLPQERYLNYSRTIGDTILGFITTDELPTLLETKLSIDEATAVAIVEDLRYFLKPVYDREKGLLPPEPEPEPSYEEKVHAESAPAAVLTKTTPTWSTAANQAKVQPTATDEVVLTPNTNQQSDNSVSQVPEPTSTSQPEDTITPMRTMAGDMKKIHGYGAYRDEYPAGTPAKERVITSSQDEVLQPERPRLADTPRVSDEAPPSA